MMPNISVPRDCAGKPVSRLQCHHRLIQGEDLPIMVKQRRMLRESWYKEEKMTQQEFELIELHNEDLQRKTGNNGSKFVEQATHISFSSSLYPITWFSITQLL